MNSRRKLKRLFTLARSALSSEPAPIEPLPYGLATRVASQWASRRQNGNLANLWLRACWWGVGSALAVCVATAVYQTSLPEPDGLDLLVDATVEVEPF